MLHIILTILKIIGIVLLVLIGMLLLAILLVLFVPVRYRITASKYEEIRGNVKITWLLHLISVHITYENNTLQNKIKILGISLNRKQKKSKKTAKPILKKAQGPKRDKKIEVTETVTVKEKPMEEVCNEPEITEIDIELNTTSEKKVSLFQKIKMFLKAILNFLMHIKEQVLTFFQRIKEMMQNIQHYAALFQDEHIKRAIALCWIQLKKILAHINPRKFQGNLHFGVEEPAVMGQILAALGILYPFFGTDMKIKPDFETQIFEGDILICGRVTAIVFLRSAWILFFNKDLRYMMKAFKKEGL